MSDPSGATVIAVLLAGLLVVVWSVRRTLNRPVEDHREFVGSHADDEYRALARKNGIHPDVAAAFEAEVSMRGREIRRKDEERRKRDAGDAGPGIDVDPF